MLNVKEKLFVMRNKKGDCDQISDRPIDDRLSTTTTQPITRVNHKGRWNFVVSTPFYKTTTMINVTHVIFHFSHSNTCQFPFMLLRRKYHIFSFLFSYALVIHVCLLCVPVTYKSNAHMCQISPQFFSYFSSSVITILFFSFTNTKTTWWWCS